ncbi:MAG: AAA family ATPase [Candidatus Acidiferrum sp.]
MYTDFYKLNRNPFEITPDPYFLYSTKQHKEALAALYYGVRQRKGFVVLTGEAGTGKTLLVRCLLQLCKGTDIASAYVFNSRLSTLDFLQYAATDLGLAVTGKHKGEILHELNRFLVSRYQKKLTTMIVVDEAHHLSTEVLEEIRLLTNLETAEEKLLQIVLVGQSELSDKLDSYELRQLKQRISLRGYLEPLDLESTRGYIHCRLQLAGANDGIVALFPNETVSRIHHFSRGIPRLINTISDNAMITAFARQLNTVLPSIIDEVASELRLHMGRPRSLTTIEAKKGANQTLSVGQSLLQLRHPS